MKFLGEIDQIFERKYLHVCHRSVCQIYRVFTCTKTTVTLRKYNCLLCCFIPDLTFTFFSFAKNLSDGIKHNWGCFWRSPFRKDSDSSSLGWILLVCIYKAISSRTIWYASIYPYSISYSSKVRAVPPTDQRVKETWKRERLVKESYFYINVIPIFY